MTDNVVPLFKEPPPQLHELIDRIRMKAATVSRKCFEARCAGGINTEEIDDIGEAIAELSILMDDVDAYVATHRGVPYETG